MEEITTYINRAIRTEQRLFDLVAELGIEARKIEDRNAPPRVEGVSRCAGHAPRCS